MKFHFKLGSCPTEQNYPKTVRQCILEDIAKTQYELETAYLGFDYVTDPALIDCYIYDINALLKRYHYLLQQVSLPDTVTTDTTTSDNLTFLDKTPSAKELFV